MKVLPTILLFSLIFLTGVAEAETYTLSPDGSHSNQNQINEALKNGNVYLNAGDYDVDNTIIIGSNRVLTGSKEARIRVYSGSSQWFKGLKGVISCEEVVHDVEISNIQIDGNIGNLPSSYANSRSDTRHDCQKLIILHGYSNQFASNIKIHDLKLYNSFSDGCYILFGENIQFYNNIVSNCQHEGFYFSCVKNGLAYGNKIAGITSDAGRLDNCVNCKVFSNLFFSYTGDSYGAWEGGQSGLQIADSGASMGYDGSKKPLSTTNIEVYNNTFSSPGLRAVWLDSTGKGVTNVYIHDNKFIGVSEIETDGTPVDVISSNNVSVEGISFENVSVENPPTLEMSEKVFSSIFDILDTTFVESAKSEQNAENISYDIKETETGKIAGGVKIIGFNNWIMIDNQSYISSLDDAIVKTSVISNPSLKAWSGGISKIDKDLDLSLENDTLTATLTAKTKWYNLKLNAEGNKVKKYKTSTYTFTDTYSPAPMVLEQPTNITGIIYQYPTYFTFSVPSNGLTKVKYEYGGNSSEHIFLVGSRNYTADGLMFTEYSDLEHWEGNLQHQGKWVFVLGTFEGNELNITAYTPYKQIEVKDFDLIKMEYPDKAISWWIYPFLLTLSILILGIRYMLKQILY